jgi:multicomponent K+:H+ antiporter subunit D
MTPETLSHWIVAPLILPALVAPIMLLAARYDLLVQRVFSLASGVALVAITLGLFVAALGGHVESYELGSWPAPFGIVMVLDLLSAIMILLTAVLALGVQVYAVATGWDGRGRHFHAIWQFQLMGLMGAMLTGDVFNLFVFFEILLIASYGLMVHGGGRMRLRGGVQYVVYNLAGSTLFLFALGTVYGVLGTLNMADMAVRVTQLPPGDAALLRVAAALLLTVFVLKGALIPVHFWLPNTYALAPAPVAALFAIMTKVGAYAVIRVWTLVFPTDLASAGDVAPTVLIPAALITLAVGMIGVLAGGSAARVVAFAAVGSMGTLFLAIGAFTPQATAAAVYYLIHSTLAAAILFLIVDQIRARRGSSGLHALPAMPGTGLVAALFFGGAIAMAGMPPLSGFLGKLLVLDALRDHALWVWVWAFVLGTSLVAVIGFARAGSILFWKSHEVQTGTPAPSEPRGNALSDHPNPGLALGSIGAMLALVVALTVFAGPAMRVADATAAQLHDRQAYVGAVLGTPVLAVLNPVAPEAAAEPETDAAVQED